MILTTLFWEIERTDVKSPSSPCRKPSGSLFTKWTLKCGLFFLKFFSCWAELWFSAFLPFVIMLSVFRGQLSLYKLLEMRDPERQCVVRAKATCSHLPNSNMCGVLLSQHMSCPPHSHGGEDAHWKKTSGSVEQQGHPPLLQETCPCKVVPAMSHHFHIVTPHQAADAGRCCIPFSSASASSQGGTKSLPGIILTDSCSAFLMSKDV